MSPNKSSPISILVVDDDQDDFQMLKNLLMDIDPSGKLFSLDWVSSYLDGKNTLNEKRHKICFLDYRLGGQTGLDLLKEMLGQECKIPIVLLTGYGEHEVDLEAMRIGAADYLIKDQMSPALLERTIRYAIRRSQSLETIRSLLDSTFEGILVHDSFGIILEMNRSASEIFGLSASDMLGKTFVSFFAPESATFFDDILKGKETINKEITVTTKEGKRLHLEISGKPYQHPNQMDQVDQVDQMVRLLTIRDVTGRKHLEAQILMQDRLASIGLLASSLAHEIGTPLGVIRGRAEYLAMQTEDAPSIKKNVDIIISQIDRVTQLIRSLLNLARGDLIRKSSEVNLSQIVSEVLDLMGHELRKNLIAIQNELQPQLPIHVRAEAQPLHQVLLNLLVNSVHAIQTAKQQGRDSEHFVRVEARETDQEFILVVRDSGCGISEKNLKNLFKPFFTTKGIGIGTGLGLATCYRIIESWGGTIHVESQESFGTVFYISFPKR